MNAPPPCPAFFGRALLPWEDAGEFDKLRALLLVEHAPKGATETSLVDQIAWIEWRRQRLLLGERAATMAALQDRLSADHKTFETLRRALVTHGQRGEKDELAETLASEASGDHAAGEDNDKDEAMTRRGIAVLETGDPDSYAEALALIRSDTRAWWEDIVGDDEQTHPDGQPHEGEDYRPHSRTAASLLRFLKEDALPMTAKTRAQLLRRPAIRLQAQGESLDPFRMDRILALDERLTRQFEKTLGMLLKLQELRAPTRPAP